MNFKTKMTALAATALTLVSTSPVFAQAVDPVVAIETAITTNLASATGIVVAAGLALIGLGFVGFILRKGRAAASGRVG
jgi:hypothetical protein